MGKLDILVFHANLPYVMIKAPSSHLLGIMAAGHLIAAPPSWDLSSIPGNWLNNIYSPFQEASIQKEVDGNIQKPNRQSRTTQKGCPRSWRITLRSQLQYICGSAFLSSQTWLPHFLHVSLLRLFSSKLFAWNSLPQSHSFQRIQSKTSVHPH